MTVTMRRIRCLEEGHRSEQSLQPDYTGSRELLRQRLCEISERLERSRRGVELPGQLPSRQHTVFNLRTRRCGCS
jgi:hypothetical protein